MVHGATIVAVALLYIVVRIVIAPTDGFLRFHMTDVLAGIALPALLALAIPPGQPLGRWVRSMRGKLTTTLAATLVWEGVVPLVSDASTADAIDALCYIAGTLLQHIALPPRLREA